MAMCVTLVKFVKLSHGKKDGAMGFKHVKPLDGPIDEGTGGVGDRRIRDAVDDETGAGTTPARDGDGLPAGPAKD